MAHTYDWDYWRGRYVSGSDSDTYLTLSKEPGAPSHDSIKREASKRKWKDQRERFRKELATHATPRAHEALVSVAHVINTAEMLTRHVSAARFAGQIGMSGLKNINPKKLTASESLKLIQWAVDAERTVEGMATARQDLTIIDKRVEKELQSTLDKLEASLPPDIYERVIAALADNGEDREQAAIADEAVDRFFPDQDDQY